MNYSDKPVFSGKKVALLSLGCKVNSYETDSIRRQFEEAGAVIVDFDEACKGMNGGADIFVINTCSVTNIADRKSRQMLRRARQNNPHAIVAATGCYAQIGAQELIDSGCADIVTGNSHKSELIDMVAARIMNMGQDMGQQDMNVSSMKDEHCYEDMRIDSCDERVRAFVKVEDGCDQFCTYCIIPYARGRVRSRSKEDVLEEIRGLA
ncbi:MAG: tRNA (N(6)-L-threonylcarbamoyladenosine(37)-C(2))-methylthiotransferase MtaB, partial [Lachnospiraceae bacterium]|nr:tRNA (N(6)-L-threonylcarbamoyladenosine(37)-C(2))-methylthiotransferase MtaB [Lachnospiraceae bacterium]